MSRSGGCEYPTSHGVRPFFLYDHGWVLNLAGIREQSVDMIDQAASQPSSATVALNLAWISSGDKFVVMVIRTCRTMSSDVCLNTQRATGRIMASHHMLEW